jgi:hypothetical protein
MKRALLALSLVAAIGLATAAPAAAGFSTSPGGGRPKVALQEMEHGRGR